MQLDDLSIAADVALLRPDFAVLALLVRGVTNRPTTTESAAWLADAERIAHARRGAPADAHVEAWSPGEVVPADAAGVACRRWNWRQGTRTRVSQGSTEVLFLLERLAPYPLSSLDTAAEALLDALRTREPRLDVHRRLFGPGLGSAGGY